MYVGGVGELPINEVISERPTGKFGEFGEEIYEDIEPGPVFKADLEINNPFILEGKEAQRAIDDTIYQGQIVQKAKAEKYDGVIFKDVAEFAIARFVGNSLKVNQVSHQVYTIKLKIRECW